MDIAGIVENETRTAHLEISGGKRLFGEVTISGSKNAALPVMAACLLVKGPVVLHNVPDLDDVETLCELLKSLGVRVVRYDSNTILIDSTDLSSHSPKKDFVSMMRASVLVMGPLVARCGKADIPLPGGCKLGARPIDIHLEGMRHLGGNISAVGESVQVTCGRLAGNDIPLRFPSVGATENLMMAACIGHGSTSIIGAAKEPEIEALADFLNMLGGRVTGAGTDVIGIEGVPELIPVDYTIIPDRIECGTYLIAAASSGGDVVCKNADPSHLTALIEKLEETGCMVRIDDGEIRITAPPRTKAVDIRTLPYPGFPTDLQPQMMALNAGSMGMAIIVEKIFDQRFLVIDELLKMGAKLRAVENAALTVGQSRLHGADVNATDIRASAALICAAVRADGVTRIHNLEHLFRGYETPLEKLSGIGTEVGLQQ